MNGRKAKLIRKMVYGDKSLRVERKYSLVNAIKRVLKGKTILYGGTFVNSGERRDYLALKQMVKAEHWTMEDIRKAANG